MPKSGLPRWTYMDPYSQRIAAIRAADESVEDENQAFADQGATRSEADTRKSWEGKYENALIRALEGGPFGGSRDYASLLDGDDMRLPSRPSTMTTHDASQPIINPNRFDFEKLFDAVPKGEPLPSDGPNDDRTDAAMEARIRSYRQADDLNWLLEGSQPPGRPSYSPPYVPPGEADDSFLGQARGLAGAAAFDFASGLPEGPRQTVGGMRDAVQSIIDMGEIADEWKSLGGFRWNPKGGIAGGHFEYVPADEWRRSLESGETVEPNLPTVGDPRTVTGGAIRAITQFMRSRRV